MSALEWLAIIITVIAAAYFMASNGITYQTIGLTVAMLVFGFMAGSMLHDLWFK